MGDFIARRNIYKLPESVAEIFVNNIFYKKHKNTWIQKNLSSNFCTAKINPAINSLYTR